MHSKNAAKTFPKHTTFLFLHTILLLVSSQLLLPPSSKATPKPTPHIPTDSFIFGVEYFLPGLAETYAQINVRSTRPAAEGFRWTDLEPNPPAIPNQHNYLWDKVDPLILEYQTAGFTHIQIYTSAQNNWASSAANNHIPDPEYFDDYEAYIFNLVERYDHDGHQDMNGLQYPILDYVIEAELTGFFPGTPAEYLQILTAANNAAKQANPDARIWLIPLMMIDVFDGNPTPEEVAERIEIDYEFRHPISEVQELLSHPDLFDVIEIHSLGDYSELAATMHWLQAEMDKHSYQKPIFIGDGLGISQFFWPLNLRALTADATNDDYLTFTPIRPEDPLTIIDLLFTIRDGDGVEQETAEAWFRAEHAKALVKKLTVAIHSGYAGMNAWATADLPIFQLPRATGSWFFQGMIEATPGPTWQPNIPRPAYHALHQTTTLLDGYTTTEKLDIAPNIHAYQFTVNNQPLIIIWYEPDRLYFPEETAPTTQITLPIATSKAQVIHTITEIGRTQPITETVTAQAGAIPLTLNSTPLFIKPLPSTTEIWLPLILSVES